MSTTILEESQRHGVLLRSRTSLAVGGRAERLFVPCSVEELRRILVQLRALGEEPFILGGGCNTLFPDRDFTRPVILTEKLRGFQVEGTRIRAEAGLRIDALIRLAIENGLEGLEMFKGIPGTVGGAVAMNAGGSGREFGKLVRSVVGVHPGSGEFVEVPGDRIEWGYRSTRLHGLVVTQVELELIPGDSAALRQRAREFMRWKASTQPLDAHSAGCIFRNPPGDRAGRLIDLAGLKGARVGGAVVSERHANFILNENGQATAADILQLIETVRSRVRELHGVDLELEIILAEDGRR